VHFHHEGVFCILAERVKYLGERFLIHRIVPMILYGIPNCSTVKKARVWLQAHALSYTFHDFKKSGVDPTHLAKWCQEHGWEKILNRSGTTFRKLPEVQRLQVNAALAQELMLAQPSMIKRPILDLGGRYLIGFDPNVYASTLT
jgi:arsenate reductase